MTLKPRAAEEQAKLLHDYHVAERTKLDVIRLFQTGRQRLPAVIPTGSPREVRVMAASSRVNVMPIVVNSLVQSMFVEALRDESGGDLTKIWEIWQANRFDARQSAVHRATSAFGTGYVVVLPGDPVPVMRSVSPRSMTALYGEDPDWPMWALERCSPGLWKLYDEDACYILRGGDGKWEWIETRHHGAEVGAPVIRFRDELDDDDDDEPISQALPYPGAYDTITRGQVAPLIPLQEQIDLTTFALQIAQHYGSFKQRYAIGWAAKDEVEAIKTAANVIMTFDVPPDSMKLGEFTQTDTANFIAAREASLRHASSLSQTPVHELTGQLVQMSAEALAAAEAGKDRKVGERQTLSGESWEQAAWLAGKYIGLDVPAGAQVGWRDTSARSFAATVDALGKLAQMLEIPVEELWERIPGANQQDIARYRAARAAIKAEPAPTPSPILGL